MVRLYVGGLQEDTTPEMIAGRFTQFGTVSSCELARNKAGCTTGTPGACRGFAHVELESTSEQALHRCLSIYNGCRWRGGVLRVEQARPGFEATLQEERQEAEEQEAAAAEAAASGHQHHVLPPADGAVVRMLRPDGKKTVTSAATAGPGSRTVFPPFKNISLESIHWQEAA